MAKKIKVFHGLLNYGTQAGVLAAEIRKQGEFSLSVAYKDKYSRLIDVQLINNLTGIKKVLNFFSKNIKKLYYFYSFNIFHFYYGNTLFVNQIDLPFYRFFGKKVIMHYLGNDVQSYKISTDKYKWSNMQAYIGDFDPEIYDSTIQKRLRKETCYLDLQIVCAPIYSEFVSNSIVIPLAINLESYIYMQPAINEKLVIMHAPSNRGVKGTDYIVEAIHKLINEGENVELILIENVKHCQLQDFYLKCDLFIDQIMSGWYGTASIEAMAYGKPVISSLRSDYFEFINYGMEIPIIHADPDSIYLVIKDLINNKTKLPDIGKKSRKFVEKYHNARTIASQLIEIYKKLLA